MCGFVGSVNFESTHRYLVEVDVRSLATGTLIGRANGVLKSPRELQQIPHYHCVHDDNENQRRNQTQYTVDNAYNPHCLEILDLQVAYLRAVLPFNHTCKYITNTKFQAVQSRRIILKIYIYSFL